MRLTNNIRDVDFMKTHFVVINDQGFQVTRREEAALPFVGCPELPGYDAWQQEDVGDTTALHLRYEEDGLLFESYLTVGELSALTWSVEKEAFVDPEGTVFTFYTEEKYRPPSPLQLLISVEGGVVQGVYSTIPADYLILDTDTEGADPDNTRILKSWDDQEVFVGGVCSATCMPVKVAAVMAEMGELIRSHYAAAPQLPADHLRYATEMIEKQPSKLSDSEIDAIAEAMLGGLDRFLKGWGWGWCQFARAVIGAAGGEDALDAAPQPPAQAAQGAAEQRAKDALDAARYRWLRDKSVPPHNLYISVPEEFKDDRYMPHEVDAYIDAARSQAQQGGSHG